MNYSKRETDTSIIIPVSSETFKAHKPLKEFLSITRPVSNATATDQQEHPSEQLGDSSSL